MAQSLIDIPQKKIDNATVLNREEKQQINGGRTKAKEALKTLNDPKATDKEKKEAEKNLRKAVADAKPAMDKLTNSSDKDKQVYVVKVYLQNGKWQAKVTLKGNPNNKTSTQKEAIEAEMNKEIAEKINELGGLHGKRSKTVTAQSTEDSGEFWVKDMDGWEWLNIPLISDPPIPKWSDPPIPRMV